MADTDVIEQRAAAYDPVNYPDSDEHFLSPNPLQAHASVRLRINLEHHFHRVPSVVLEGNMFMYYQEGNPAAEHLAGRVLGAGSRPW